ncbi:MAG: hypothetical protein JSV84_05180 [Gemmatimonadota bacterium]|nr:MAG: hypothetical protein JSV84_05180 [Gemmatimonadota bacterium]
MRDRRTSTVIPEGDSYGVQVRVDRSHLLFPGESQGTMRNKFAIIDSTTVIAGSYNWTNEDRTVRNNCRSSQVRYWKLLSRILFR